MEDIRGIVKDGGNFAVSYKRSLLDITGKMVEIPVGVSVKTIAEMEAEIAVWVARAADCQANILKLKAELTQCKAII